MVYEPRVDKINAQTFFSSQILEGVVRRSFAKFEDCFVLTTHITVYRVPREYLCKTTGKCSFSCISRRELFEAKFLSLNAFSAIVCATAEKYPSCGIFSYL